MLSTCLVLLQTHFGDKVADILSFFLNQHIHYSRNLTEPPRIDVDSRFRKQFAHVGGVAKISVAFEGEPTPTVAWYKDGLQIRGKSNVNIDTTDFSSVLGFKRITRDDDGEYEIVVKNECGTSKERFSLKVMGEWK